MTTPWTDLVGRCFVLGMPNAKGEYVITLGGHPLADRQSAADPGRGAGEGGAAGGGVD
jgi:hypothetical protein